MKILHVLAFALLVFISLFSHTTVSAKTIELAEDRVLVHFFYRDGCKHCEDESEFLYNQLLLERNDYEVKQYNIEDERDLWLKVVEKAGVSKVTPITVIGYDVYVGFNSADTTGVTFKEAIDKYKGQERIDIENVLSTTSLNVNGITSTCNADEPCEIEPSAAKDFWVKIPFTSKQINVKDYSLPTLSLVLGTIDGFNPCAMWVLVTFILILTQIGNRRKMFIFVGVFLLAEAIMYHLILSLWLTAWDFIGLNQIVTPAVGVLALGSGTYFLYRYYKHEVECKVTDLDTKAKTSNRIKELASKKFTVFTFIGIFLLAFSVNIFEFACSIGIPQAFTKILELQQLSLLQMEPYLLIYMFGYMVDDLIVFGLALWSIEKIGLTSKYTHFSNLIGGILMVLIGLAMLLKPELLSVI